MEIIIYNQENGIPAILTPTPESLETHSIMEVAIKDVPVGRPFKIIDVSELAEFQDIPHEAWEIDDADLTVGVGGDSN